MGLSIEMNKIKKLFTPQTIRWTVGFSLIYFWVSTIKKPETLFIHGVLQQFKYVLWAGIFWQIISLLISVISQHPSDRRIAGQIQFDRLFSYLVAFTGMFWVTANYGDRVYVLYQDNLVALASDIACLFIVWFGLLISRHFRPSESDNGFASSGAGATAGWRPSLSKRDKRYVAVHESGHALTYAALNSLPKHVEVRLLPESQNGTLGYISGVMSEHRLMADDYCEWLMICLVAGKEAELVMFGKTNISGFTDTSDFVRWHDLATGYLANQKTGLFFVKPADALEQDHNVKQLTALRQKHQVMARDIIETNKGILDEMAEQLLQHGKINNRQLSKLLAQTSVPENFPTPDVIDEALLASEQS